MARDGLRDLVQQARRSGDITSGDPRADKREKARKDAIRNLGDQSIRGFLERLERRDEIIRFEKQVDPATNMAAVEW
ncbi:MAG: hypothetical protein QGF09_10870, partial [Rhodospirillales bacterium]|nr:hypothetical protein [Rhodospirillales bacterium]